jgi:hypothetical protein
MKRIVKQGHFKARIQHIQHLNDTILGLQLPLSNQILDFVLKGLKSNSVVSVSVLIVLTYPGKLLRTVSDGTAVLTEEFLDTKVPELLRILIDVQVNGVLAVHQFGVFLIEFEFNFHVQFLLFKFRATSRKVKVKVPKKSQKKSQICSNHPK